jgi:hypothetical protein
VFCKTTLPSRPTPRQLAVALFGTLRHLSHYRLFVEENYYSDNSEKTHISEIQDYSLCSSATKS